MPSISVAGYTVRITASREVGRKGDFRNVILVVLEGLSFPMVGVDGAELCWICCGRRGVVDGEPIWLC